MASAYPPPSTLVVVQGQAACPFWMDHWGEEPRDDWSMLEQEEWEPEVAFTERLRAALGRAGLEPGATRLILVASASSEPVAMGERWRLANELLRHVDQSSGGELVVTRGFGHRDTPQAALEALVRDLVAEWQEVAVRLCLSEVPPVSTVRTSYPPPNVERGATA